jgi:predicted methyltransferase
MRRSLAATALIAAVSCTAAGAWAAKGPAGPAYVSAALADPARGDDRNSDANRKPGEIVAFAGVKPGQKVADLIPGHGYWTEIFSKVVGPRGHVYMVWPAEYAAEDKDDVTVTRALAANPAFKNVSVLDQTAAAFSAPEKLDVVFTSQNYHDYPDKFMGPTDPMILNRAVYKALKPGGVFIVIDHAAQSGSGLRDTDTLHRIDPAIVKAQVTAAGFVYEGESRVLRNPADDHKLLVFKKEIRGHTDQFIFKFRKPLHAKR